MVEVRPLSDLRVLDCSSFVAGPFATAILAEYGAEVIKVEPPAGGDPFRRFGTASGRPDATLAFLSEARNKHCITLNLKDPRGADVFRRLAAESDVVCENFRPGTLERWGLGYDALSKANPGLVMLRITAYGQDGPYRDLPGFARIAHAFGGLTYLAGMPGETPVTPGSTSLGDYMSGLFGVIGVLVALRQREKDGRGQQVDIGLYESVFRVLDELAPAYAKTGKVREPEGPGTVNACPHGHFPTGDGGWVAIACTSDKMFERLARVMGRPELAGPEAWGPVARRLAERERVDGLVADWTRSMPRDEVIGRCRAGQVPCGPINTIADIFADPHYKARGNLLSLVDALAGEVVVPATPPRLSRTPARAEWLGRSLGADTDAVLERLLGLSPETIAELRRDGVI